jgi:hypothetical protein
LPDLELKTINSEIRLKEIENKNDDSSVNKNISKNFKTNIEELNLLGHSGDGEIQTFCFNSANKNSEFHIDTLNL